MKIERQGKISSSTLIIGECFMDDNKNLFLVVDDDVYKKGIDTFSVVNLTTNKFERFKENVMVEKVHVKIVIE